MKPDHKQSRSHDMKNGLRPELMNAERELDEAKTLVERQYGIVKRLRHLGADSREAILLLLNLLDLQQSRAQRLSFLRMRGTDPGAGKFNYR